MIFEESDSDDEEKGVRRPLPFPATAGGERDRSGSSQGAGSMHTRSPSVPVAPQVNVEEVDDATQQTTSLPPRPYHVKASSVDITMQLERRPSPLSEHSMDSDSPSSRQGSPQPLGIGELNSFRVRSETMDSDSLLISYVNGKDPMPMEKRGSELSETGSLRVPVPLGGISEDSGEEGGGGGEGVDTDSKLLYLMVARCIAYPFNAKFQLETAPPKPKLNEERFQSVVTMLKACNQRDWEAIHRSAISLNSVEQKCVQSDRFQNCLDWYLANVMERADVVHMSKSGSFSVKELESIFKVLSMKHITYTSTDQQLDTSELQSWCSTFRKLVEHSARGIRNSGGAGPRSMSPTTASGGAGPNREKLYKLFQKILHIKSIEHSILYKECQLGVYEDQEAVVRRELQRREQAIKNKSQKLYVGRFGSHRVEELYRDEELRHLKHLMTNLENLSFSATGSAQLPQRKKKQGNNETGNTAIPKPNLSLKLKVTVQEVQQLPTTAPTTEGKRIFCVFELVEGGNDPLQTHPEYISNNSASFDISGEFWTHSPLPEVRYTLRMETKGIFSDDRIIARRTIPIIPTSADMTEYVELHRSERDPTPVGKLRTVIQLEKPPNMRKCGYLYSQGETVFKQPKKRFFMLTQLGQYKFYLCTYLPRDTQPRDMIQLEDFTVDYLNENEGESDLDKESTAHPYKFILVSEVARLQFGCRDNTDRQAWVQWIYRATGQNFVPTMEKKGDRRSGMKESDRYGLSAVIARDVSTVDCHRMFEGLFRSILEYRLKEDAFSRGLFSPEQLYILDEFCARYGVRDPFRHFTCLREWMACEEDGVSIWPVMLLSSFRFCQMHVGGINPPEKKVIATREEQDSLTQVSQMIEDLVLRKIENFRSKFPFGCPKDDLKVTLKLFNLVAAMNHKGPGNTDDTPHSILTLALERAALVNYKQIYREMENTIGEELPTPLPFSHVSDLAHYCIEYMYELHDFYWEDFTQVSIMFTSHINAFWMVFMVDLRETMATEDNTLLKLRLFHTVNQYFCSQPTMKLGKFHLAFLEEFTPVVVHYMEGLEASMREDLARSFSLEAWMPVSTCCVAVKQTLTALQSLKSFLSDLNWPEEAMASHLQSRVRGICVDRFMEAAEFTKEQLLHIYGAVSITLSSSLPLEVFTIINTLVYLNSQLVPLCSPQDAPLISRDNRNMEDHLAAVLHNAVAKTIDKLCDPLVKILHKLTRYDPSDSVLASLKILMSTSIPISSYSHFLATTLAGVSQHLVPEVLSSFIMNWFECQIHLVNQWLEKRPSFSLHPEQLCAISALKEAFHSSFSALPLSPDQLNSEAYLVLEDRVRIEKSKDDLLSLGK